MTDLEHIEIEGFKGLEYVEFEPTDINVITGRNNTGKTSFLEAVDIFFAPRHVSGFAENIGRLVHVDHRKCEVRGRTSNDVSTVQIDTPPEKEAKEYFIGLLVDSVSLSIGDSHGLAHYDRETAPEYAKEVENSLKQAIEQVVKRDKKNLFSNWRSMCLRLEFDDRIYPYIDVENIAAEVSMDVYNELKETLESKFEHVEFEERRGWAVIHTGSNNKPVLFDFNGRIWQGSFLEEPPTQGHVRFVGSGRSTTRLPESDKEENAVRIDDIGDFIKEKELVDDLKTFDIDYLVFEKEDGEKYQIPFDFMGDGFKSIVGLLWELMDDEVDNEIVLIEEPENHMHPGYVSELVHFLIDLARDESTQFFITTHDHDFIKDFFMDMPEEKREYLEDEFSLVKMDDFGADVLDYDDAEHHLKDLHLDLRGI